MRKSILFATMVFFGAAAPAAAQTFGFGAHAGVSLPTGDYADAAKTGFSGGLDLTYPLMAVPGLSWYTSVDAVAHSGENEGTGALYFPLMTGARFDIPAGPVGLFLTGQLGVLFNRETNDDDLVDPEWATNFGFNFGGGAQITENVYAGLKYYPLGEIDFEYADFDEGVPVDVSFLDIYVGFGVF